jgi:hypothetical protein
MLRSAWVSVQRWRWPIRWLIKCGFLLAVVFLTLYPHPSLFVKDIQHLRHLDAMPDPDSPALAPWARELAAQLPANATPRQRIDIVQKFVYEKVPYAFDWDTWGVADYLPTVSEAVAKGRGDCGTRALIAASLLQRYDPTARMVTDCKHMWVKADAGECMHPAGPEVIEATPTGLKTRWSNVINIRGPAYGMAVFPLARELIIVAAVTLVLCDPRMRTRTAVGAVLLLVQGLLVVRLAARNPWAPVMWGVWLGLAEMAAASIMMGVATRRGRRPGT